MDEKDIIFDDKNQSEFKEQAQKRKAEGSKLRDLSLEEQAQLNNETESKTNAFWRLARIIKDNLDQGIVSLIIICSMGLCYSFVKLKLGWTSAEISDFLELVLFFVGTICSTLGLNFVSPGTVRQSWSGKISKKHDADGKSLPG